MHRWLLMIKKKTHKWMKKMYLKKILLKKQTIFFVFVFVFVFLECRSEKRRGTYAKQGSDGFDVPKQHVNQLDEGAWASCHCWREENKIIDKKKCIYSSIEHNTQLWFILVINYNQSNTRLTFLIIFFFETRLFILTGH